jgi:peptidoglycan/LPS O-acetylase OafA/YrhL
MQRQFPALRGLAIFLVVVNHSITLSLQVARESGGVNPIVEKWVLIAIKEFGIIAVPIFLFIAGSFFVYAAQGRTIKNAYKQVWASLVHTIPPYILWSLVYYLVMFFLINERATVIGYLRNLVVGYPFNFVPLLIAFYLIAPLLIWLAKRVAWIVLLVSLAYQIFLIAVLRPELFPFTLPGWSNYLAPPVLRLSLAIWGIFYPLGIVFGLHSNLVLSLLKRWWFLIAISGLGLFILAFLSEVGVVDFPLAAVFGPVVGILLIPLIKRDWIPFVRVLEQLGKRSYGLYLTNLIVINLLLALVKAAAPWMLSIQSLLAALLIVITLAGPQWIMGWVEQGPGRKVYRFAFG